MNKKPNILVVGSINMDLVLRTHKIPSAGESHIGIDYTHIPGGKGANQAVAAALLGANVDFAGKVGRDSNGLRLKKGIESKGISTEYLTVDEQSQTGLAVVMLEDTGQNRIIIFSGANMQIRSEEVQKAFEKNYDAVIIQFEVPQEIVIETCTLATEKNIPVVVDAGPAQNFPLEKINGITILSPNETETREMCGIEPDSIENTEKAAKILKQRSNADIIVIKMGKKGALLYSGENSKLFSAPEVKVVDTTAAGDAFTGALALEYIKSGNIEKAIKFANIVGALTVTKLGAQPSLPFIREVGKFAIERGIKW